MTKNLSILKIGLKTLDNNDEDGFERWIMN